MGFDSRAQVCILGKGCCLFVFIFFFNIKREDPVWKRNNNESTFTEIEHFLNTSASQALVLDTLPDLHPTPCRELTSFIGIR